MKKNKSSESILTEAFETHIVNNNLPNVRYEYFDFHEACIFLFEYFFFFFNEFIKVNQIIIFIRINNIFQIRQAIAILKL